MLLSTDSWGGCTCVGFRVIVLCADLSYKSLCYIHMCAYTHTYIHTIQTYICIHTHAYTHTYTHKWNWIEEKRDTERTACKMDGEEDRVRGGESVQPWVAQCTENFLLWSVVATSNFSFSQTSATLGNTWLLWVCQREGLLVEPEQELGFQISVEKLPHEGHVWGNRI